MLKKCFLVLIALSLAGVLVAGSSFAADEVKVGIMVSTTGGTATDGKDMERAIQLAADEINAAGGILGKKIVTTTGDDACDPQQSVAAASKLISEKVVAVVGGYCSGATLPTLKLYGEANVPFVITASNSTALVGANPGIGFMVNSTGDAQADTAVALFKSLGVKKIALVHMGEAYSEDLASIAKQKWEAAGEQIVAYEVVNKGEQDFSSLVTTLKSKSPDAVFWTAYYAEGALLIKQLRQAGYRGTIAIGDGSNSPKLIEIAGKAAEGVYCFSNPIVDYLPAAKGFSKSFTAKYKVAPGPYSTLSYDGMMLLADAIKRAGSFDQDAIKKALKATDNYAGIAGPISFTDKLTLARSNFVTLQVKDQKWQLHK
jgi:branched-chain amino acid transport system substrate-binding protein